jgi:two-component system response regulator FimZ (fimbrial Z protein)
MIRVAIADDHAVIRKGLQLFIGEDESIELVGEAADGEQLLELLKTTQIDILLLDIDMPKINGLALLRDLETAYPKLRTIILSMHPEKIYGINARRMGAKGYISKENDPSMILESVKSVAEGKTIFTEEIYRFNRHGFVPAVKMSKREAQVLKLLVSGRSNKDISEELEISDKTVSTYKLRLMRKLNAKSIVDLVRYAEMSTV